MVEGGAGRHNAGRYNYWGRKRTETTWMSWGSPKEAIYNQAAYVARMWGEWAQPENMKGYCIPQYPWATKVRREMSRI